MNINIENEEIQALDIILKEAKVDIKTGFILSNLRVKIQKMLNKEFEQMKKKKAKEILGIKNDK